MKGLTCWTTASSSIPEKPFKNGTREQQKRKGREGAVCVREKESLNSMRGKEKKCQTDEG